MRSYTLVKADYAFAVGLLNDFSELITKQGPKLKGELVVENFEEDNCSGTRLVCVLGESEETKERAYRTIAEVMGPSDGPIDKVTSSLQLTTISSPTAVSDTLCSLIEDKPKTMDSLVDIAMKLDKLVLDEYWAPMMIDNDLYHLDRLINEMGRCMNQYEKAIGTRDETNIVNLAYKIVELEMKIEKEQELLSTIVCSVKPGTDIGDFVFNSMGQMEELTELSTKYTKVMEKGLELDESLEKLYGDEASRRFSIICLREQIDPTYKKDIDKLKDKLNTEIFFDKANKQLNQDVNKSYQ